MSQPTDPQTLAKIYNNLPPADKRRDPITQAAWLNFVSGLWPDLFQQYAATKGYQLKVKALADATTDAERGQILGDMAWHIVLRPETGFRAWLNARAAARRRKEKEELDNS